jgi:hypothetical protein
MTHSFERDPPETPWYRIAFFYAITIIASGASVALVIYYAL